MRTNKQEEPEKKSRNAQEERGTKRGTDEWEKHTKGLKAGAERGAEESKKAKVGDDADDDAMMEAVGAV